MHSGRHKRSIYGLLYGVLLLLLLLAACRSLKSQKAKASQKPIKLAYKIVARFPHDTSAYTQGLSYVDGKLLESTGREGESKLKWVDLQTGEPLQQTALKANYFGEGSVKVDHRILMLTWQEGTGLIYDAHTLTPMGTFPYGASREGWGLTFNGKQVLKSDGSNRIWFINKDTYKEEGYIRVYRKKKKVWGLNELEYIEGKIYANVFPGNEIVIINPESGRVEAYLDLSALVPKKYFKTPFEEGNNVLNGIAWDEEGKRLFVGGKKWPFIYQISILWPE